MKSDFKFYKQVVERGNLPIILVIENCDGVEWSYGLFPLKPAVECASIIGRVLKSNNRGITVHVFWLNGEPLEVFYSWSTFKECTFLDAKLHYENLKDEVV